MRKQDMVNPQRIAYWFDHRYWREYVPLGPPPNLPDGRLSTLIKRCRMGHPGHASLAVGPHRVTQPGDSGHWCREVRKRPL